MKSFYLCRIRNKLIKLTILCAIYRYPNQNMEFINNLLTTEFSSRTWTAFPWDEATKVRLHSLITGTLILELPDQVKYRHIPPTLLAELRAASTDEEITSQIQSILNAAVSAPATFYNDPFFVINTAICGIASSCQQQLTAAWQPMLTGYSVDPETRQPNNEYGILDVIHEDTCMILVKAAHSSEAMRKSNKYIRDCFQQDIQSFGERMASLIESLKFFPGGAHIPEQSMEEIRDLYRIYTTNSIVKTTVDAMPGYDLGSVLYKLHDSLSTAVPVDVQ